MKLKQTLKNIGSKFFIFLLGLTFFAGVSVFAQWPEAPAGEVIGGWLGEIFNLNESSSGQLALNSKKLVLPSDASPISENKQVTTKEYVDSSVSAAESSSSTTIGGGSVFTLVGEEDGIPACPNGYTSAQNGYWQCARKYQAVGDCFCGQRKDYHEYNGSWTSSSLSSYDQYHLGNGGFSRYYRCAVCVPATTNNHGDNVSEGSTILWITHAIYKGNLGGRSGADAKCIADQPDYLKDKCSDVKAFLSVDRSDEIIDLANCDPDKDTYTGAYECKRPVYWFDSSWNKFTIAANDWEELASGTIQNSAQTAGISGTNYWTGSIGSLRFRSGDSCQKWSSTSDDYNAYFGSIVEQDSRWIAYSNTHCNSRHKILCACKYK